MTCEDCQNQYLEAADESSLKTGIQEHLAGCRSCHDFVHAWKNIDQELSSLAARTQIPDTFNTRLYERLAQQPARLSPGEIALLKKEYDREYEWALARLRKQFFAFSPWLLTRLGLVVLAATLAGLGLQKAALNWASVGGNSMESTWQWGWLIGLLLGLAYAIFEIRKLARKGLMVPQ